MIASAAQKELMKKIYAAASEELGVEELSGGQHNPRVLAYHAATNSGAKVDEEAWCAAFVSFILESLKLKSTKSAWSRSYSSWGVRLEKPELGCVVVFTRPEAGPTKGHVAFFVSEDAEKVYVLGGNQSNKVSIAGYPKSRLLAYRGPSV